MEFSGRYPDNLHEEINNYSIVAGVVARQQDYDIIHANDWLTYPAGIHAKQVSGKPLVIHVQSAVCSSAMPSTEPTSRSGVRTSLPSAERYIAVYSW